MLFWCFSGSFLVLFWCFCGAFWCFSGAFWPWCSGAFWCFSGAFLMLSGAFLVLSGSGALVLFGAFLSSTKPALPGPGAFSKRLPQRLGQHRRCTGDS